VSNETTSVLALVLVQLLCAVISPYAEEFKVTGSLVFTRYDARTNVSVRKELTFSVEVASNRWIISTAPKVTNAADAVILSQVGTDGSNIFSVRYLNPEASRTTITGAPVRKAANGAVSEIYRGLVPRGDGSFAAPLWLAYASSQYLNTTTNQLLPKVWADGQRLDSNWLSASWSKLPGSPGLPDRITYFSDGKRYVETPENIVKEVIEPAPYDKGFVQGSFETLTVTNYNSLLLPRAFRIVRYVVYDRAHAAQLRVSSTIEGQVMSLYPAHLSVDFRPQISTVTAVQDYRPQWKKDAFPEGISYTATSNWLESEELQKASQFKQSPQGRTMKSDHSSRIGIVFMLFCLATAVGVFLFNRASRNTD